MNVKLETAKANIVNLTLPLPVTKGKNQKEGTGLLKEWQDFGATMAMALDIEVRLNPCRNGEKAMWASLYQDRFLRGDIYGAFYVPTDENEVDAKVQKYLEEHGVKHNRVYPKILQVHNLLWDIYTNMTLEEFLASHPDNKDACLAVQWLVVGGSFEIVIGPDNSRITRLQ